MIYQNTPLRWNQLLGDPYTRSLSPLMLLEGGQTFQKLTRTLDRSEKQIYSITYDKEYIYSYIAKKVLKNLQIASKEDAIAMIEDAWDYYEQSWSQVNSDLEI